MPAPRPFVLVLMPYAGRRLCPIRQERVSSSRQQEQRRFDHQHVATTAADPSSSVCQLLPVQPEEGLGITAQQQHDCFYWGTGRMSAHALCQREPLHACVGRCPVHAFVQ